VTGGLNRLSAVFAAEVLVIAALLTLALDIRAHANVERAGGVNVWGYRGPVAHQRQSNEIRIAVVGGTRAFGWGEPASALPSNLRQFIMATTDRPGQPLRPVVVINLARLGALPDTYPAALSHYGYIRPDYICVYDDLGERGAAFDAHASAVFELTGYAPTLPLMFHEKGMAWRFGTVSRGYEAAPLANGSGWRQAGGTALQAGGAFLLGLDRAAGHAIGGATKPVDETPPAYTTQIVAAIAAAHARARGVVLVLSPAESGVQAARRGALLARLDSTASWLRVVDLEPHRELRDPEMRIDGWNYGSAGITRTAQLIAPAFLDLIGVR